MVARLTYFRTKWRTLPDAYACFLIGLAPDAPVVLVEDTSTCGRAGRRPARLPDRRTRRSRAPGTPPQPPPQPRRAQSGVGCRPRLRQRPRGPLPRTATRWSGFTTPARKLPDC
jgi:hypothetical protein